MDREKEKRGRRISPDGFGKVLAFSGLFRKRFDGHVLDGKYRRLGLGLIGDEFPTIPSDMTVKVEFST